MSNVMHLTCFSPRPRHLSGALGSGQRVCDVEEYHAENRSVGPERDPGRARPAIARRTPALGVCRAAPGRPLPAAAVAAAALPAASRLATLFRPANRRPIDEAGRAERPRARDLG